MSCIGVARSNPPPPGSGAVWLVGGNQAGAAAITGWRDLFGPALANKDIAVSIWPFDGDLVKLLRRRSVVVAETYPADVYRHLDLAIRRNKRSKRRQSDRAENAGAMNRWAPTRQMHPGGSTPRGDRGRFR